MPTRPSSSPKAALKAALIEALEAALAAARAAHASAMEGAFHEEAKAENDKDTRGLEQSYLARGVAQRVVDLETGLAQVQAMTIEPAAKVAIGSLVTTEDADDAATQTYFIAPAGGGTALGATQVLTLSSPIGRALANKQLDDEIEIALPKGRRTLTITRLQ